MKATGSRRAHFPVGGKRNTLNFFGHGNRPKKKQKVKTAAEEEDDERPRRRRRKGTPSQQWAILAATGALGAAGLYWAFQNPKQVRTAAKELGIADNEVVRGALDTLDPKKPEDRVAKEAELASAAAAEHGSAAPKVTNQEPVARPKPRELNTQEAGYVTALRNAGHTDAASQLEWTWQHMPDAGPLPLPRQPTGDPVRDAGDFMAARAQYNEFKNRIELDIRETAAQHGASAAEIDQLADAAKPQALSAYKKWVHSPATWGDSWKLWSPHAQGFGEKEIRDATSELAQGALRDAGSANEAQEGALQDFMARGRDEHQVARLPIKPTDATAQEVANRNLQAQRRDVASSHPAMSPFAATADHADQVLTAVSPRVLGQLNMLLSPAFWGADARGVMNPQGDPNAAVIRNPEDHWQANRARAVLDRQNAVLEAQRAGDHEGAKRLLAEPLPGSQETLADIEAANRAAELHDVGGRASQMAGLSTALRVSAPFMGPLGVIGVGGGLALGAPAAIRRWKDGKWVNDSPEGRAQTTQAAGSVGGFAAQTAAMRSRPQIAVQVISQQLEGLRQRLASTLQKQGPGKAYEALLQQIEQQTGKLQAAQQAARAKPGVGAIPESLHALRTELRAPPNASFGTRVTSAMKSGFQQAKWVGSLSTAAEATEALGRISQTAVKSPALVALMRVNAVRGVGALSAATVQYGIIGTGALAVADISGHALNAIQGEARSRSYQEQYRRAFNGTLRADGRFESNWGTGGYAGNARDMGATARNAVMMDFQYIMERQAAVTGYSRAKFEGGSHDVIRGVGATVSGVNDPQTGFYESSAEYRGVQDAMYFTAERRALQRGTEIATQIIEGDPRFANASVAVRDAAIMTTAARISAQYVGRLQGTTILEHNIDEAIGALDLKVKSFKPNPVTLLDSSGSQIYNEGARFMEHILPGDVMQNKELMEQVNSLGHYNAALNSGIQDPDALISQGKVQDVVDASDNYAWQNRSRMAALPGGIGDAFKAHEAVYGPTRRAVERALGAPELRHMDPKRRDAIYQAAMKNVETQLKPRLEQFLATSKTKDLSELTQPSTGPNGEPAQPLLKTWLQEMGIKEAPRSVLGITGSAEAARDTGFAEIRRLLPPEAQPLLDPAAITAEADRLTGQTFDQRNNTEAGLYTKSSPTGQAVAARREQWAHDLRVSGVRLPLDDQSFQQFRDTVENGGWSTAQSLDNPTWDRASKLALLEEFAARNPEAIRQVDMRAKDITPVLLAQERPVLEKALAGPNGGFTTLGPDGKPVGTVGSWYDLQKDITANPQNYAKAWRPEVQKYLQDYTSYRARLDQARPTAAPEVAAELSSRAIYDRRMAAERKQFQEAHAPPPPPPAKPPEPGPLGFIKQVVGPLRPSQFGKSPLNPLTPPAPRWTPSQSYEEFDQAYRENPTKYHDGLSSAAQAHLQAMKAWESRDVRAPAGPGPTPRYAPAPKPAPVSPAVAAVTPAPAATGQPAKP